MRPETKLLIIKWLHTLVWAIFAGCIVAAPALAAVGRLTPALWLSGFVLLEVIVLALNRMRCPLTDVAARYTTDRQDNFDIFLPLWLARHNKVIFGTLYIVGAGYTLWAWLFTDSA